MGPGSPVLPQAAFGLSSTVLSFFYMDDESQASLLGSPLSGASGHEITLRNWLMGFCASSSEAG